MTKTQATDMGSKHGEMYATAMTDDALRATYEGAVEDFRHAANTRCFDTGVRSIESPNAIAYIDAFRQAAIRTYNARRNELPDVKAANRLEEFQHAIIWMMSSAQSALEQFKTRFAEDPFYAFEWADGAMEAAAKAYVAKTIQAWMERTNNDIDAVQNEILKAMHQGARCPSRSTSQPSNLMAQYKTAAFAEFVRVKE
jgi:hypothetical protein